MKRTWLVLLVVGLAQVCAPDRAYAWWEYIERLSGAGPFTGWSLEARLVCLVDPDGDGPATAEARIVSPLESVFASCKLRDQQIRRGSFDMNMRFVWRDNDGRFANGERISLTTLAPSVSWNIIPDPDLDFVDVGIAGGVYWFSSTGFPSFNGGFLEPIRLDFHAPTNFKRDHPRLLLPRLRIGMTGFPGGFEPHVFAPTSPEHARRISRDWVLNVAIFVDIEALLMPRR